MKMIKNADLTPSPTKIPLKGMLGVAFLCITRAVYNKNTAHKIIVSWPHWITGLLEAFHEADL